MIHIYLDSEFDAVRVKGKFMQSIISIGAVLVSEEGIVLDQFYSLVRPEFFKRLNPVVARMTHLSAEQIKGAQHLHDVMRNFRNWIRSYEKDEQQVRCYSFGPDDRRTLVQNCKFHKIEEAYFEHMHDLQKELSSQVFFEGRIVSSTLSLENLKAVFDIHGEVEHNALTDALDLMKIHQAYCQGNKQNSTQIEAIVKRKLAKEEEVRQRQKERLKDKMKKRFTTMPKHVPLVFYDEVLDQLRALKEQGSRIPYRMRKNHLETSLGTKIPYAQITAVLLLLMDEEVPMACIQLQYDSEEHEIRIPLTYHTATSIEIIIKRCM